MVRVSNVAKILIRASAISGSAREILQATSVNKSTFQCRM